jgi:hypothetical protein
MFGTIFSHGTLRKYVIFFGTLFNNIWIKRYNGATLVQTFKVPLNYGPRDKFLARLEGDPTLTRPIAIQLPRMSFEIVGLYYDSTRKFSTINRIQSANTTDPNSSNYQYSPVPYNIEFELSILVKNAEDGTFIVEQILPYFTPEWTATLNINPDLGLKYDVPLILESVNQTDTYEGNFTQRRAIIWSLRFTMKGYLFGPTKSTGSGAKLIKEIDVNLIVPPNGVTVADAQANTTEDLINIDIKPGMFSNGDPTSTVNGLYTYSLQSPSGVFILGEKVVSSTNTKNYAYVVSSNSQAFQARNIQGTLANTITVVGAQSGYTATINGIQRTPPASVSSNTILATDDYGFLIDFQDNF